MSEANDVEHDAVDIAYKRGSYLFNIIAEEQGIRVEFTNKTSGAEPNTIEVIDAIMIIESMKTIVHEGGVEPEVLNTFLDSLKIVDETSEEISNQIGAQDGQEIRKEQTEK
jgi:hypothetical protein